MKKFASTLLALAMILSLCIPALADGATYELVINGAAGHTYDIFQIFTGDVVKEGEDLVLTNVKYGQNNYPVGGAPGTPVPKTELLDLVNSSNIVTHLESAVNDRNNPFRKNLTPAAGETSIKVDGIPGGYYMIVDVSGNLDGQTKSPIMLQILGNITVTSKHATIVSEKKVKDKNDSDSTVDGGWVDSADYDIGDPVPFQLSDTLPSTLGAYSSYEVTFHDKQDAGFNAPTITSVYILKTDNTKIEIHEAQSGGNGYTLTNSCTKPGTCEYGGCSFNVKIGDVKALYGTTPFAAGDKLVIEYTSVLNNGATVGRGGNFNSMYVCHPDGHTPKDTVVVFTYELKINKIDGDSKTALPGAGFTLYKWDGTDWAKVCDEIKGRDDTGNEITSFTWTGIDDGRYKLVESTTPSGYNTIADKEFEVVARHDETWTAGGNSAFLDLNAEQNGVTIFDDADENGVEDGKLEGDVENFKGVVLPDTGAKGTIILLTVSALLVMIAAVFMITRKKMSIYAD